MKKEIKTENLILKPANPAFAKARLDYYTSNRGYFTPYEPDMPDDFFELEASEAYLSYEKEMNEKGISHHFYAFLKDDPEKIVGTISFYHIRPMPYSSATVGYNVDHLLWGKGYGGELCSADLRPFRHGYRRPVFGHLRKARPCRAGGSPR